MAEEAAKGGQTEVEKPANTRKLEHDMSAAPFMGPGKIEYEEVYRDFEKVMDELTKNKDLMWMDFFEMAPELEKEIKENGMIVIETKKYKCLFNNRPGIESRKFRASDNHTYATRFYTWQEVVDMMTLWKTEKFNPNLLVDLDKFCVNRNFRHVHIFKHKKGFLVANQFDMTYPEEIMNACIILGK